MKSWSDSGRKTEAALKMRPPRRWFDTSRLEALPLVALQRAASSRPLDKHNRGDIDLKIRLGTTPETTGDIVRNIVRNFVRNITRDITRAGW